MEKPMERLIKLIGKVYRSVLSDGVANTGLRVLHRLRVLSVLHGFHFVLIELNPDTFESRGFRSGMVNDCGLRLTFREVRPEELMELRFAEGMYTVETMQMHMGKGMRFFAAFLEGIVVSVSGINTRTADLVYIKVPDLPLADGVAYLNCALTAPAYRNQSIGTEVRSYMLSHMAREGVRIVFAAVFMDNKDALRWNLRNGFQYLGKIYYIRCGCLDFHWQRLNRAGSRYEYLFNASRRDCQHVITEVA